MPGPWDYQIEILPWAPGQLAGLLAPVDVTNDATLEDFGSINRAVERDFLSFRSGDLTFALINDDGKYDEMFLLFAATDRWQLKVTRRSRVLFLGMIMGQGSVTFDRDNRMVEITAYGVTKVLDETSAAGVKRTVADMTVTTATSGQSQITLNSTSGLLTGDVLHVTDHVNRQDLTVKEVTSSTVCTLEAALSNNYAAGSPVVLSTPFYRYKSVDFLVRALAAVANVPIAEIKISGSLFRTPAPTPVNLEGLDLSHAPLTNPAEKDGRVFITEDTIGTKSQLTPDVAWAAEDATVRSWVDWSRYYREDEAAPTTFLRNGVTDADSGSVPHRCGWDFRAGTKVKYIYSGNKIDSSTSADGLTWSAPALFVALPGAFPPAGSETSVELDPTRNYLYAAGTGAFQVYDIGGAAWTDLKQADDGGKDYWGPVYVPDLDVILAMRGSAQAGPAFEIAAFRGKTRLWVRPFPSYLTQIPLDGFLRYATQNMRMVKGVLVTVAVSDGQAQFIVSKDQFQTFLIGSLGDTTLPRIFGARVAGYYRYFHEVGSTPRGYGLAAPFYAGIVPYANFAAKSLAEGLAALAVLVKATFWIDDDFQLHFVARDQVPTGDIPDLTARDLLLEQSEVQIWEESRPYVQVSGGGFTAVAGDADFASDAASITSDLIPNGAYAQSLADDWLAFISARRPLIEAPVFDEEDLQLLPMRRVVIDGRRFYVHESDHSPMQDEWSVKFLEDLEGQSP